MNWNLVGSIYGRSSLKSAHFVMIHYQTWPSTGNSCYRPIRDKNCLWRPCLLTDRDEMNDLHGGHSIDASCHVSVHLAKRFQRRRFKKNCQLETRIACGGPCLVLHVGIHILIFFLAHLAKGNVGFWHHLASVVCYLSSVNFSHFNLLLWNPSAKATPLTLPCPNLVNTVKPIYSGHPGETDKMTTI
jgi:hypothetical protein